MLPIIANIPTKININTASTLLLLSLDSRITRKEALVLYKEGQAANKSLADFFRQPAIQIYHLGGTSLQMRRLIATRSRWYQAEVNIKMEQTIFQKYALLYRTSAHATVKQWSQTAYN